MSTFSNSEPNSTWLHTYQQTKYPVSANMLQSSFSTFSPKKFNTHLAIYLYWWIKRIRNFDWKDSGWESFQREPLSGLGSWETMDLYGWYMQTPAESATTAAEMFTQTTCQQTQPFSPCSQTVHMSNCMDKKLGHLHSSQSGQDLLAHGTYVCRQLR